MKHETDAIIAHIEKALEIKLLPFQKDCIMLNSFALPGGRRSGKMLLFCIQLAISEGPPLDLRKNISNAMSTAYFSTYFRDVFLNIHLLLEDYGFKVRDIIKG